MKKPISSRREKSKTITAADLFCGGGGTYCADAYPTLTQLYAAIGERRAPLAEHQAPSPIAGEVAA